MDQGTSNKDLDIFIYPHNGKMLAPALVRFKLVTAGLKLEAEYGQSANSHDSKVIETWSYKGQRIDIFFVQ